MCSAAPSTSSRGIASTRLDRKEACPFSCLGQAFRGPVSPWVAQNPSKIQVTYHNTKQRLGTWGPRWKDPGSFLGGGVSYRHKYGWLKAMALVPEFIPKSGPQAT